MRIFTYILFACVICVKPVLAQEELGLKELIDLALEQNYQIKVLRNNVEIAQNSNTAGNAGMLPEVMADAEIRQQINTSRQEFFSGDTQEATNAQNNAFSAGLGARWIIFDGFAMFARKEQLNQLELRSKADQRFFLEQTVADLAIAYYQLKQESQLLKAYQKSLEVSQTRFKYTQKAYEVGSANMLDVQLARVDRNTDSSLVITQEARIQELALSINRIINRELTAGIEPTDSIRLTASFNLPELLASAQSANASLNAQQIEELIALNESKIRRGGLFPEVEVFGTYGFNRQTNEVGFLQSSRTFGPDFGLRVRFNLFSGGQENIATRNAVIAAENAALVYDDLSLEVNAAVRTAYLQWKAALKQVSVEREGISAALQALNIASEQYQVGIITNIEFRIIQLNAVDAQTRLLQAQFIAKSREIELLRISGQLLEAVI
jgi:outer membrane protein TolC